MSLCGHFLGVVIRLERVLNQVFDDRSRLSLLMTYEQALAFWNSRINFEQRSPQPDDLNLDRIRALLQLLGDPQRRLRIIHVAGSKGKGSTSAMLASILQQAGYRTGLFTSPHLTRVEERIQIDGAPITADELTGLMEEVERAVAVLDRGVLSRPVTFFDIVTALGFLHFVQRRVEVAVVEVGLGGRFDSTNVCLPLVSVITSISLDHTQQLGTELAAIAMEKAGIVKPGRPLVSGVTGPEPRAVIARICRERRAPLRELASDFQVNDQPAHIGFERDRRPTVVIRTARRVWPTMELGLIGAHQAANAALVVAGVELLQDEGLHISDRAVAAGLQSVQWPARMEIVGRQPLVVLDCAHNVASAQALVETLAVSFPAGRKRLVFAVSSDKDVPGILHVLAPHFVHLHLTRFGSSSRSVDPAQLAEMLRQISAVPFSTHDQARDAWLAARAAADPEDLICVTGSVFLAGELRPTLLGS